MTSIERDNTWELTELPKGHVKSTFLHGALEEQIFVDQPPGYVKVTQEGKVYKLKKLEVVQSIGGIFISQKKYMNEILKRIQMECYNFVSILAETGVKLVKDLNGEKVDNTFYRKLVGSLMYVTTTRLDIMLIVSLVSRFMEHSKEIHLIAAKQILSVRNNIIWNIIQEGRKFRFAWNQ
ncbi:hypothetical protein CR513_53201, partial [Mucuna pruriens]